MDRDRFDALSRLAATSGSRRAVLAGALGLALLHQHAVDIEAGCRGKNGKALRRCRRRQRAVDAPGSGRCGLAGELCGDLLGVECCGPLKCTTTLGVVSNCVLPCTTDDQCRKQFIYNQVSCKADALTCPFIAGGKCCVAQSCLFDGDCQSGYTCQGGVCKR